MDRPDYVRYMDMTDDEYDRWVRRRNRRDLLCEVAFVAVCAVLLVAVTAAAIWFW